MTTKTLEARVFRFDPSLDQAARYETFEVPHEKGMRVLGVLLYIQEKLDTTLAFRYSCRRRRCGSCGVMVNGRPVLACIAEAKPQMVIEPSPNLPVVRDLVVDAAVYEERILETDPYLHRDHRPAEEPEKLFPRDFGISRPLTQCIECFSCVNACPVNGIRWDFAGPSSLVQIARWFFDPRDEMMRVPHAVRAGLKHCVSCYSCVNVCPVEIGILDGAIEHLKREVVRTKEGSYSRYNETFKQLIVNDGMVNPFVLMRKSVGIDELFRNLVKGAKFLLKGKVTIRRKRISKVHEVRTIRDRIGERT